MSTLQTTASITPPGGVEVRRTVELLRRYTFLEQSCIRALAEWFLRTPGVDTKIAMGYRLWAHAERANDLRTRLSELRGGHHQANVEPALMQLGQELSAAPDAESFLAGWALLLRHLAGAYQQHLDASDASANAQEVRILRRLTADIAACLRWADDQTCHRRQTAHDWCDHLNALLLAAGGIDGLAPRSSAVATPAAPRLPWPTEMRFEPRIRQQPLSTYEQRLNMPLDQCRVAEMEIFFNEFYAAALLATVIVDAWSSAPWEFLFDMSHHFWDEVRHAEFGLVRLRELGIEPDRVNMALFEAAKHLPFLHRLCYLTLGLEVYFMPRKKPRYERYRHCGDQRSQLFADVDWSDEGNHVRYGKRWVEHFLRDDARDVQSLQDEIFEHLRQAGLAVERGRPAPF